MHPKSRLTSADVEAICQWTQARLNALPPDALSDQRAPRGPE